MPEPAQSPDRPTRPGTPTWVKAAVLIVIGLALVMGIVHLVDPALMGHMPLTP